MAWNQSVSSRSSGSDIAERKRKTKKTGKSPWTASPEPVRSAAKRPIVPKATVIETESATITRAPPKPAASSAPAAAWGAAPTGGRAGRLGFVARRSRPHRLHFLAAFLTVFVPGALQRAPGLGEEDVVERGRVQLQLLDRDALGVEGTD